MTDLIIFCLPPICCRHFPARSEAIALVHKVLEIQLLRSQMKQGCPMCLLVVLAAGESLWARDHSIALCMQQLASSAGSCVSELPCPRLLYVASGRSNNMYDKMPMMYAESAASIRMALLSDTNNNWLILSD
jgi:hypothetical protein